ncbi:MAG: hypothetical protein ACQKBY_05775 [Verrucomicrobiales bacterium]
MKTFPAKIALTALLPAGVCFLLAALSLHWPPLRALEEKILAILSRADFVESAPDLPARARTFQIKSLPESPAPLTYQTGDDPERLFQKSPPSPPDWLVILKRAHEQGFSQITIAELLSWENADALELGALEHGLAQFPRAVLGIDLRREATEAPLPPWLERSRIPLSSLAGSAELFPVVNRVPFPPSATGPGVTYYGFRQIETSPPEIDGSLIHFPLLARWGDALLPSLELAHLMAQHELSPGELRIVPGQHLRLGEKGPLIALDEFGRTSAALASSTQHPPATELLFQEDQKKNDQPAETVLCLVEKDAPPQLRQLPANLSLLSARFAIPAHALQQPAPWLYALGTYLFTCLFLLIASSPRKRFWILVPFLLALPLVLPNFGIWLTAIPFLVTALLLALLPHSPDFSSADHALSSSGSKSAARFTSHKKIRLRRKKRRH